MTRDDAIRLYDQPWRFEAGQFVITNGVKRQLTESMGEQDGTGYLAACYLRHRQCDWGDVDPEDAEVNNAAVESGGRIISAYPVDKGGDRRGWGDNSIWLITEADRSTTTALLPSEY